MSGAKRLAGYSPTQLASWKYISGDYYTFAANETHTFTAPSTASIVEIRAEGGELYFEPNAIHASALSPFYVPEDQAEILGPLATLNSLRVFTTTASTVAHVAWFCEA